MALKTCRLCSCQKPNTQPIFIEMSKGMPVNALKSHLPDLIATYLHLKIDRNDDLPKNICIQCYRKLKRWKQYAKMCKTAQKKLKSLAPVIETMPTSSPEKANCVPSILTESLHGILIKTDEVVSITPIEDLVLIPTEPEIEVQIPAEREIDTSKKVEAVIYSCSHCDKTYSNKQTYRRHVSSVHENPQKLQCAHCSKTFLAKASLKCHLETHAASRDFCCHECGATFRTGSALRGHLSLHRRGDGGHACATCGKRFKLPHHLERHRRTHSDARPHQCSECPRAFALRNHLTRHVVSIHQQVTKRACPTCGKAYRYLNHYRAHLLRHAGQRDNGCAECGKAFVTRNELMRHMRTHTREKPFKCPLCAKSFADCSNRKRHVLSHDDAAKPRPRPRRKPAAAATTAKTYASLETFYQQAAEFAGVGDPLIDASDCFAAAAKAKTGYGIFLKTMDDGIFFDGIEMPVFLEAGGGADMEGFVIGEEILVDGSLM